MILVVGDVIVDEYQYHRTSNKVNPDGAHIPVLVSDGTLSFSGAANLVARTVHASTPTALVCALPAQPATPEGGHETLSALAGGVTRKQRFVVDGDTQYRVDYDYLLSEEESAGVTCLVLNNLPGADLVVVSDFNKGAITEGGFKEILRESHSRGIPVLVDPKKPLNVYAGADLIKANKAEFLRFYGATESSMDTAACIAVRDLGLKYLVITDGPNGSHLYTETSHKKFPVPDDIVRGTDKPNVVGAGDVQMAHIAASYGPGTEQSVELAVKLAVRAASEYVFRSQP